MPDTALLHMVQPEDRTRCGNVIHRHSDMEHAVYWEESKLRYVTACGLLVPTAWMRVTPGCRCGRGNGAMICAGP